MPINRTAAPGAVTLLTIEMGRGNAIDHAFIDALNAALDDVEGDPGARTVVLTGHGRTFCAGLDLVQSDAFDRPAMERYVDAFDGLFVRVAAFPRPIVAAVNGHALAGGCILALAADYRIMARGAFAIGINEVLLGIPFPAGAFEVAARGIPAAVLGEAFLEGRRYSPEEALAAGIVHRLGEAAGEGSVVEAAIEKARRFGEGETEAVRATKGDLTAAMLARIKGARAARRERFLEAWFAPEARARRRRVVEALAAKRPATGSRS